MPRPTMQAVSSSNIAEVGYDPKLQDLWIKFHDGGTYVFENVPPAEYRALVNASSVGGYFHRSIQHSYSWRKVV